MVLHKTCWRNYAGLLPDLDAAFAQYDVGAGVK
jgi:hypothetical protein